MIKFLHKLYRRFGSNYMCIGANRAVLTLIITLCSSSLYAQRASLSVDALKSAVGIPNITSEILLSNHLTLNVEAIVNPFDESYKGIYAKQLTFSPELRYWFKRPIYSHFVGLNLMGSTYNVGYQDHRYKGRIIAAGVTYGYSLYLAPRWALTPTVGFGYGYGDNSTLDGGIYIDSGWKGRATITKLGLYISYIID